MIFSYQILFLTFLFVFTFVDFSNCSYTIDDGILFSLKFPSADKKADSSSKAEESSAVPVDEALLGGQLSEDLETVLMTTNRNEKYYCNLPKSDTNGAKAKESYTGPNILNILEKLFVSQACAYRLEHYWTYELCHGRFLRQFHEERDGKKVKVTEYILGEYTKDQFSTEVAELEASVLNGSLRKPLKKKIETMNMPYYEIEMRGGTTCDLTGLPRMTRVQYVCYPKGKHEIYSFKESSTCEYEVIVLSNIICTHPDYRPEESNEQLISCTPADDKTSRKPFDLISMETEALKFRSKKMFEAHMFQGEKGPGSVKIEIKPYNPDSTTPKDDSDENEKYHEQNWKETLRREPFRPLMDPQVVKEFLLGQHCLHGGTGWWKYEFCYGKFVIQYHEEKTGQRTVINLGRFDEKLHLQWLENNPHKRPKPPSLRKQISYFYSDGDICDVTGKPRQVEVKLKCKHQESTSAVSLYLLEPKTCEYILGIESPLVCDVLHRADDQTGLMSVQFDDEDIFESTNVKVDRTGFVEPQKMEQFTEEDAVQSPYGDVKNVPFTDDSIIVITDGDQEFVASDYDEGEDETKTP